MIIAVFISVLLFPGCEKEELNKLIGKWRFVKTYSVMGGAYLPEAEEQRIEEYTKNERILYDYLGNETGRCSYISNDSVITLYGEKPDGAHWEDSYRYWFITDTLIIRYDGGFESYHDYFIPY